MTNYAKALVRWSFSGPRFASKWAQRLLLASILVMLAGVVATLPVAAQTLDRPATYFWGKPADIKKADPRMYRDPPARVAEWEGRSPETRKLVEDLKKAAVCPIASVETITDCYKVAQKRPDTQNGVVGFLKVAVIGYVAGPPVYEIVANAGSIAGDYGKPLYEASTDLRTGVFRAQCQFARIQLSNMGGIIPRGPYPVINYDGGVTSAAMARLVPGPNSAPGHGFATFDLTMEKGRAIIAIPEVLFKRAKVVPGGPIIEVGLYDIHGVKLEPEGLPRNARGYFSIPSNPSLGVHNRILQAIEETGLVRYAYVVQMEDVQNGRCSVEDYASRRARQPPRKPEWLPTANLN